MQLSTTRLYASKAAWADPAKRVRIEQVRGAGADGWPRRLYSSRFNNRQLALQPPPPQLGLLLKSVLDARGRLMVTFNVPDAATLEKVLSFLPSLRSPTVSSLHHGAGFAVQVAAQAGAVPELVPLIKEHGGMDIVISSIRMLVA